MVLTSLCAGPRSRTFGGMSCQGVIQGAVGGSRALPAIYASVFVFLKYVPGIPKYIIYDDDMILIDFMSVVLIVTGCKPKNDVTVSRLLWACRF